MHKRTAFNWNQRRNDEKIAAFSIYTQIKLEHHKQRTSPAPALAYRARQLYKNISMLFLFPVKDGKLSTGVIAIFNDHVTVSLQQSKITLKKQLYKYYIDANVLYVCALSAR